MGPYIRKCRKDSFLLGKLMFIGNCGWFFFFSATDLHCRQCYKRRSQPACRCLVVIIRDRPLIVLPSLKILHQNSVRRHQKLLRTKSATVINIQDKRFWTCSACGGAAEQTLAAEISFLDAFFLMWHIFPFTMI